MQRMHYLLLALALVGVRAEADNYVSGNIGFMSDYFFRGIEQSSSTANGGIDWENSGFYAGTWLADVDDGIEYDLYGGYSGSIGEFGYTIGYTGYFYSDSFDDTYHEGNLLLNWRFIDLEYSRGRWEGFGDEQDYNFFAAQVGWEGLYLKYGAFSDDFDGSYWQGGYERTVGDFDTALYLVYQDDDLGPDSNEMNLVFEISYSFDIFGGGGD